MTNVGIILQDTNVAPRNGVATGGSGTTLVDSGMTFNAVQVIGGTSYPAVVVGDTIMVTGGPGAGQRLVVTVVAATTLTFAAATVALAAGSQYQLLRTNGGAVAIVVNGTLRTKHQYRLSVKDVPNRTGDVQQLLGRKSRRISIQDGTVYRFQNDAASLADVRNMRSWSDGGTVVYLTSQVEAQLATRIEAYEVVEYAGKKGYVVVLQLVEVN